MNRLKFLKTLLVGAVAAVVAPLLPKRAVTSGTANWDAAKPCAWRINHSAEGWADPEPLYNIMLVKPEFEDKSRELMAKFESEERAM